MTTTDLHDFSNLAVQEFINSYTEWIVVHSIAWLILNSFLLFIFVSILISVVKDIVKEKDPSSSLCLLALGLVLLCFLTLAGIAGDISNLISPRAEAISQFLEDINP